MTTLQIPQTSNAEKKIPRMILTILPHRGAFRAFGNFWACQAVTRALTISKSCSAAFGSPSLVESSISWSANARSLSPLRTYAWTHDDPTVRKTPTAPMRATTTPESIPELYRDPQAGGPAPVPWSGRSFCRTSTCLRWHGS